MPVVCILASRLTDVAGFIKTARTVAVRQSETINRAALTAMLKQIIANNRAGGVRRRGRRLKGNGEPAPPDHLREARVEKL